MNSSALDIAKFTRNATDVSIMTKRSHARSRNTLDKRHNSFHTIPSTKEKEKWGNNSCIFTQIFVFDKKKNFFFSSKGFPLLFVWDWEKYNFNTSYEHKFISMCIVMPFLCCDFVWNKTKTNYSFVTVFLFSLLLFGGSLCV